MTELTPQQRAICLKFYEDLKRRVFTNPRKKEHILMLKKIDDAGDEIPDLVAGGLRTLERRMK